MFHGVGRSLPDLMAATVAGSTSFTVSRTRRRSYRVHDLWNNTGHLTKRPCSDTAPAHRQQGVYDQAVVHTT